MIVKFSNFLCLAILIMLFSSCNTQERKKAVTIENSNNKNEYSYTIDTSGISVVWTAYKFTDKLGVSGTFKDFTMHKKNASGSIESVLNSLKLSIPTSSVNSKNAIRDFKLNNYFFKVFNTLVITGTITSAKENEGFIRLQMNKKSRKIPFTFSLKNDTIALFTHLDLKNWKGEEALNILNKECYELHKGTDGISKLWPDVDVSIKLPVTKVAKDQ